MRRLTPIRPASGGFVSDAASLPISNAKVRVINEATGLERATETNSSGLYQFDALDPGSYELRVESKDSGVSLRRIVLNVGGSIHINIGFGIEAKAETVDLSRSALSVTESNASDVVTYDVIHGLPIDGRRFQDFATLYPAVQALPETRGQLSFVGQRGIYSNVMLDGNDYNEPFLGGIRGGERSNYAFTISQSAIREFQVIQSAPPVEYGRTSGGTLNTSTRSGLQLIARRGVLSHSRPEPRSRGSAGTRAAGATAAIRRRRGRSGSERQALLLCRGGASNGLVSPGCPLRNAR